MPSKNRNYKKEYENYQGRPEQIKNRSERNKARRKMEKVVGKSKLRGKDVDHKVPLSCGGSNDMKNLQITSVRYNRSKKDKK